MQDERDESKQLRQRRPYEPPRVEESAEFETLAMNCTFDDSDVPACAFGMLTNS